VSELIFCAQKRAEESKQHISRLGRTARCSGDGLEAARNGHITNSGLKDGLRSLFHHPEGGEHHQF